MAFSDAEKTEIRRFCGYPAYGTGGLLQGWRYYQVYGLLEYRLLYLSNAEEEVVRRYLATLSTLERAVVEASGNILTPSRRRRGRTTATKSAIAFGCSTTGGDGCAASWAFRRGQSLAQATSCWWYDARRHS